MHLSAEHHTEDMAGLSSEVSSVQRYADVTHNQQPQQQQLQHRPQQPRGGPTQPQPQAPAPPYQQNRPAQAPARQGTADQAGAAARRPAIPGRPQAAATAARGAPLHAPGPQPGSRHPTPPGARMPPARQPPARASPPAQPGGQRWEGVVQAKGRGTGHGAYVAFGRRACCIGRCCWLLGSKGRRLNRGCI